MATHETATLGQFAELTGIIIRALPKAIDGLDIRETMRLAATRNEQLSGYLREVLTSLNKPTQDQKAEKPIAPALPTKFTIGDRIYELVPFLKEGEISIRGDVMVVRAEKLNANLGKEDGQFILKHQDEIPVELRREIFMVFTNWPDLSYPQRISCLEWGSFSWFQSWRWLDSRWCGESSRLVRLLS